MIGLLAGIGSAIGGLLSGAGGVVVGAGSAALQVGGAALGTIAQVGGQVIGALPTIAQSVSAALPAVASTVQSIRTISGQEPKQQISATQPIYVVGTSQPAQVTYPAYIPMPTITSGAQPAVSDKEAYWIAQSKMQEQEKLLGTLLPIGLILVAVLILTKK